MIKSFDKATVARVSAEAEAALEALATKYGLELVRGNGKYNADSYTGAFTFKVVANAETGEPADFKKYSKLLGLPDGSFGKVFCYSGKTLKVTGLEIKNRTYPISCEDTKSGKKYKIPARAVPGYSGWDANLPL